MRFRFIEHHAPHLAGAADVPRARGLAERLLRLARPARERDEPPPIGSCSPTSDACMPSITAAMAARACMPRSAPRAAGQPWPGRALMRRHGIRPWPPPLPADDHRQPP